MSRRQLVFAVAGICVAALSPAIFRMTWRVHAQPGAHPSIPYQITYKTYGGGMSLPHPILMSDMVRAVRSDGSTFESSTMYKLDGSIHSQWRQIELAGGLSLRAADRLGLMSEVRNPAADATRARRQWDPAQSCAVQFDGGHANPVAALTRDTLLGYETYRIVMMSGNRHRITIWRAPALGCAELGSLAETLDERSGSFRTVSEEKVADLRPGESDAALFDLPRGLKTVSADELSAEEMAACCYVN